MSRPWSPFVVGALAPGIRLRPAWPLGAMAAAVVLAAAAWYGVRAAQDAERLARGAHLVATAQYGAAVRVLVPVVATAPDKPQAHYYLGLAYRGLGLPSAALAQLEEAVRLAPQDARIHAGLADAYREAGRAALALAELEDAARREPGNPRYPATIAGILLDQGRADEAAERLRAALRHRGAAPELHVLLAAALRRIGNADPAAAECREAIRLAEGTPLAELARRECRAMQAQLLTTQGGIHP
jgi:tetratricopeptide (TPR) repeat protein